MSTVVFYHAECSDGVTSALCMMLRNRVLSGLGLAADIGVDFVPCHYDVKEHTTQHVDKDTEVFFVDFCGTADEVRTICAAAKSVFVIDHHIKAKSHLDILAAEKIPNLTVHFDVAHSGAYLCWKFAIESVKTYVPTNSYAADDQRSTLALLEKLEELVLCVEDRDLWKFTRKNTNMVTDLLSVTAYDLEAYLEIGRDLAASVTSPDMLGMLRDKAETINEVRRYQVARSVERMVPCVDSKGRIFLFGNVVQYISDVGHTALDENPVADYTVTYFDKDTCFVETPNGVEIYATRIFSLRARKDGVDVNEIASRYGGGGHKAASGCSMSVSSTVKLADLKKS